MKLRNQVPIAMAVAAGAFLGLAPAAHAGTPSVHGCMGNTIAYSAHTLAPFGQFVAPLARAGEVALDVHTIQSGGFTDEEFPNSCN